MRNSFVFTISLALFLLSRSVLADDVDLPAPVLQWSFYILLMFAICVGFGIFFFNRSKNGKSEPLSTLLDSKHDNIHSVGPDTLVTDTVIQMNENKVGAMLVMENDRLLGIFTERDVLTRVLGKGLDPATTAVSAVMSRDPLCVSPSATLEEAMKIVTEQRIRHLPVVEEGLILGMVSSGDLTRQLVSEQTGEVQELVYVAGRRRNTQ